MPAGSQHIAEDARLSHAIAQHDYTGPGHHKLGLPLPQHSQQRHAEKTKGRACSAGGCSGGA
jgi:hypothetical protein